MVIVVGPSATATGRTLGRDGAPMASVRLQCTLTHESYYVIIYELDDPLAAPRDGSPHLLNTFVETNADSRFTITGLVPVHSAFVTLNAPKLPFVAFLLDNTSQSLDVTGLGPFDLGDISYAPPDP